MSTVVQRRLMVINQGGGGGVTAVTADAPLAITGAPATPNVIISGAGATPGDALVWNGVAYSDVSKKKTMNTTTRLTAAGDVHGEFQEPEAQVLQGMLRNVLPPHD